MLEGMERRIWHRHYDPGVPVSLDYRDQTVVDFLDSTVREHGDRPALAFLNRRFDYGQLRQQVDRLATALYQLGVEPGVRVAVHLPNLPQTVISVFAVLRLGGQVVMTNPLYTEREIEHQWNDSECRVAITGDWLWEQRVRGIRSKLPVRDYVVTSIPEYLRFPLNLLAPLKLKRMDPPMTARVEWGPGVHSFRSLVRDHPAMAPRPKLAMDDTAVVQYTGGTTGVSKGAELTHRNLSCNVQQVTAWFTGVEPGREVMLSALPMFHVFGLTVCTLWPVYVGAKIVVQTDPRNIAQIIRAIEKEEVTLFPAVPALFNAINQWPDIAKSDLSSVKYCFSGSAPLPEDVQVRFEELTGARIVEGFGLTETSPVVTANPLEGMRKIGSIGIPLPDTDARIVDPEDGVTEMPVGESGELAVKGPQVMKGYLNRPEETAQVLRGGWLYTGDLATMDEDGYFRIVGRKKDMILASGYNVYPDEIDRVLMAHPHVFESATIGVPDPKRGETVKAFLVPHPGQEIDLESVKQWARENLAAYKVPDHWEVREELPKSSMMKLLRRVLREEEIRKRQAAESDAGAEGGGGQG